MVGAARGLSQSRQSQHWSNYKAHTSVLRGPVSAPAPSVRTGALVVGRSGSRLYKWLPEWEPKSSQASASAVRSSASSGRVSSGHSSRSYAAGLARSSTLSLLAMLELLPLGVVSREPDWELGALPGCVSVHWVPGSQTATVNSHSRAALPAGCSQSEQ